MTTCFRPAYHIPITTSCVRDFQERNYHLIFHPAWFTIYLCRRIRWACPCCLRQASSYHHTQRCAGQSLRSIHTLRGRCILRSLIDNYSFACTLGTDLYVARFYRYLVSSTCLPPDGPLAQLQFFRPCSTPKVLTPTPVATSKRFPTSNQW